MRAALARLLRKLADWLAPTQAPAPIKVQGGGPGTTPPPPGSGGDE